MRVTIYMAMSANGLVARKNGEEDFLSHANWNKCESLAKEHGNLVVGRKTYEAVKAWGEGYSFDTIAGVEKVVVSQNISQTLDESWIAAYSPQDAVDKLSQKGFDSVFITGGPALNSAFAKEGLLDEIILNVEPILIGQGIPLFAEEDFDLNIELISSENNSDLLTLHYRVIK